MKQTLKLEPRIGWRWIGKEIAAFNCINQEIVVWNEIASRLWEMIATGSRSNDLVDWITTNYLINRADAERDIIKFLQEADSLGFIKYEDKPTKKQIDIDTVGGENALLDLEMKAIERLIPFAITFETTYACNEKCVHCYMTNQGSPPLSLLEINQILDDIATEGCLFVSFTGGEFFTRADALEIVKYANDKHFVVDILSNGTLINQDSAKTLATLSVRRVQITLYGATPSTHDAITRLPGSFQKTLKGVQFLLKAGIKVEIAFPLMSLNFHERYLVKDLAKSLDCPISPSPIITARNDGSKDTFSLRLSDKQIKEFLEDKSLSNLYAGRKPFEDHQTYFGFSNLLNWYHTCCTVFKTIK